MNLRKLLSIVSVFCLSACSLGKGYTPEEIKQQRQDTLAQIKLEDGIDYEEAKILSNIYFYGFVSGCGMPGEIFDKGDHWETELIVGYAAQKMKDNLMIDKLTGLMTLKGGPTIVNPLKEFADPAVRAPIIAGPLDVTETMPPAEKIENYVPASR